MQKAMKRAQIERKARAYLTRARKVKNGHHPHQLTADQFDRVVRDTVARTERDLRAAGVRILD